MHPLLSPEARDLTLKSSRPEPKGKPASQSGRRVVLPERGKLSEATASRMLRAQLDARCVARAPESHWKTGLWILLVLGALLLYGALS